MASDFYDLLLDNGEIVRIEYPTKYTDDVFETLRNAMRRKDTWSVEQFDGASMSYMGLPIRNLNTVRVVGEL